MRTCASHPQKKRIACTPAPPQTLHQARLSWKASMRCCVRCTGNMHTENARLCVSCSTSERYSFLAGSAPLSVSELSLIATTTTTTTTASLDITISIIVMNIVITTTESTATVRALSLNPAVVTIVSISSASLTRERPGEGHRGTNAPVL